MQVESKVEGKRNLVQSLDRALSLLEEIAASGGEVGITELSNRVELHKSTVHRLLNTLVCKGFVEQNPETGDYKLGMKILELAGGIFNELEIREQARPYLKELRDTVGETAHLVIRDGEQGVYIDKVESSQAIRMHSQIGRRIPLHSTAVGKVLLADLDRDKLEKMFEPGRLKRYTEHTVTDWEKFLGELQRVAGQGYAVDNEEYEPAVRCIAAPVKNHTGQVAAAISVSGPVFRLNVEKIETVARVVKEKAMLISQRLGYLGNRD